MKRAPLRFAEGELQFDQGEKALALDHSMDGAKPWPKHTIVLSTGRWLIEKLVNLDAIPQGQFTM